MCTVGCLMFGIRNLCLDDVAGREVIEVGSCEVFGSLRPFVESWGPKSYLGVDIVLCTEVLEHTRNWRKVVSNLKNLCRPGGILLVTTRSRGFHYHAYPHDFWRYETEDIRHIFSDLDIVQVERDPRDPGVFVKAVRPDRFVEKDLSGFPLYSVVTGKRTIEIGEADFRSLHFLRVRYRIRKKELKKKFKAAIRSWFSSII